ncbi:MAG: DEAD/DEAH box helicase, partial [Acidimicrobiales bacterium]
GPPGPAATRAPRHWRRELAVSQAAAAAAHPVAACPDARAHLRALDRSDRLERDIERVARRIKGRTESLARQFDRVLRVLEAWGYVEGWALTESGQRLARLYHECDLLIVECAAQGLLDGLDPPELAALASVFTYETRGQTEAGAHYPTARLRNLWPKVDRLAAELNRAEQEAGLPLTRRPDPGFMDLAHAWAGGHDLAHVIEGEEMSGGDFVRNVKQLIDLLRQLGELAAHPATAASARAGAEGLFRGVVAASSTVST